MGLLFRYRYALMVIKTDPCAFTEIKIYPGRGSRFAGKDGKVHFFITSKARTLFHQKIKPVKLTWTQASRRYNKKIKVEDIQKKRTRKTTRDKALDATKKELKARNVKKMQEKKVSASKNNKAASTKAPAAKAAPKIKQAKGSKR